MAAGDESAERSQLLAGRLTLPPLLARFETALPALCAAEDALTCAVLECGRLTPSEQYELLAMAADQWPAAVRDEAIPPVGNAQQNPHRTLEQFGRKLAKFGPWCGKDDCDELAAAGYSKPAIVQAVATVALGQFRCTLVAGFSGSSRTCPERSPSEPPDWKETPGPFLAPATADIDALDESFAQIRSMFGFVPALLRLQSWLPTLVAAETQVIDAVFGSEEHLSLLQKHRLAVSLARANCSNYLVALHGELLNLIGSTAEETSELLDNLDTCSLPQTDKQMCLEASKLQLLPSAVQQPIDWPALSRAGLNDGQITDGIVAAALTNFLSTIQFGLGAPPDFEPLRTFHVKDVYLSGVENRLIQNDICLEDPDRAFVTRVKAGDTDAFEDLVRSHTRRVFSTLCGLLGNPEEARDATQDTFLKAFEHIDRFEGRSKFSTWLTSIAVNTGTELLRRRRPVESLHVDESEDNFRPRQVRSWVDSPEDALAKSQRDELVRRGVLRLPEKYRAALLLRDINQLSTEDAAEALGLTVTATKARILRGRLMLREALAAHFSKAEGDRHV